LARIRIARISDQAIFVAALGRRSSSETKPLIEYVVLSLIVCLPSLPGHVFSWRFAWRYDKPGSSAFQHDNRAQGCSV
jgi:hypothetical protein